MPNRRFNFYWPTNTENPPIQPIDNNAMHEDA